MPWEPTDYFGDGETDYFGGQAPKGHAPLGGALDYLTQPVKSLFGATGGIGGKLAGLLLPEAYERARKANLQANAEAEGEAPNWLEQVETLPGLGDVLVEAAQPTSKVGRALAPVGRIVGNIAGDPTTYLAGLGLLGNLPKAGKGLQAAAKAGTAIDRGLGVAAAAYLPETLQGVGEGLGQTVESLKKGEYGEAAVSGTSTGLLGALSYLMGKGLITQAKAFKMAQEAGVSREAAAAAVGEASPGNMKPDAPVDMPSGPPGGKPARPPRQARRPAAVAEPVAEVPPGAIEVPPPASAPRAQEPPGAVAAAESAPDPSAAPIVDPAAPQAATGPSGARPEAAPAAPTAPPTTLEGQLQATLDAAQSGKKVLAPKTPAPGPDPEELRVFLQDPANQNTPSIQRRFRIGFKKATELLDAHRASSTLPPTPREALGLPPEGQIPPATAPERTAANDQGPTANAPQEPVPSEPAPPGAGEPPPGRGGQGGEPPRRGPEVSAEEPWWDTPEGGRIVKQLQDKGLEVPADLGLARRLVKGADIPEQPMRQPIPGEPVQPRSAGPGPLVGARATPKEPPVEIVEAYSPGSLPKDQAEAVQREAAKDYPEYPRKVEVPSQPLEPNQKAVLDKLRVDYEGPARRVTESRVRKLQQAGFHADPAELQGHIDTALNRLALKGKEPTRGEVLTALKNASNDYARRLRTEKRSAVTRAGSVEDAVARGAEPRAISPEDEALADISSRDVEKHVEELKAAEKKLPDVLNGLPDNTRKAWEYMRANPDEPLTSVAKALKDEKGKPLFNSAQSLGQHLKRADSAVEQAFGFNLRQRKAKGPAVERPTVPEPKAALPDPTEGQTVADWATANKEALAEHLPWLASQKGRGAHRDVLVELYNELGLNPEGLARDSLSSSPKLAGAIMQKLGLEPPAWISGQMKKVLSPEELEALRGRAGTTTEPRRAKLETLKESPTERGLYTAESDAAKLEIRRAGDTFEIEDAAGSVDAITDLLGKALKDASVLESSPILKLEKELFGDLIEALERSPALRLGKIAADFVFFGKRGKPVTMDFMGLQQLSEAAGALAKAGWSKAGPALAHGLDLMAGGLKDIGAWTAAMAREFGSEVRKVARQVYNAVAKALEVGEPGSAKWEAQRGAFSWKKLGGRDKEDLAEAGKAVKEAVKPPLKPPSPEGFEAVMGQGETGPTKGAPGGIAREKGKRERVENINLNTARIELNSEQGLREAIALDKVLGRPEKRSWETVAKEVVEQVQKETPEAFVERISKLQGKLPDTDVTHLRLLTNQALDTMTGLKDRFYKELDSETADPARLADMLDEAIAGVGQAEEFLKASKETKAAYARALAIMRMKLTGMDPQLTDRARLREHLKALSVKAEAVPSILDKFSKWQLSDAEKDLDDFLEAIKNNSEHKKLDQALFLWKVFLLTPASQTANVASNVLSLKARGWEQNWIAPALDKVWSAVTGRERSIYHVPARLYNKHMASAFGSAWGRLQEEMERIVKLKPLAPHYLGGISDLNIRMAAPFKGKMGEFLGTMFKLLEVGDSFAKTLVQQRELLSRGWTLASKEGLKGAAAEARASEIIKDITLAGEFRRAGEKVPEGLQHLLEHVDGIEAAMKRDTFQKGLSGVWHDIGKALQSQGGKPFQLFVPFYKTPVNIALETMARTPVGMARTLMKLAQGKYKGKDRELMEELSRGVLGSILTTGALAMAFAGDITGGGPADPKRQAMLKETGWQPYSVRIGDHYIAYNRLEPISSLIGIAADMAEAINRGEASKANTLMAKVFSSVAENLTNKTFLSGLEGLFTAWHDPKQYGDRLLKQLQGSLVPNTVGPVPFGSLARAMDPYFRQTEALTSEPFKAKVPGLSDELRAQTTGLGRERKRPGSVVERLLSPFSRSEAQDTPEAAVAAELERVNFIPSPARSTVRIGGKEVQLTEQEVQLMTKARSQATQAAYRVVNDPTYKALPDNEEDPRSFGGRRKTKEDVLRRIYDRYAKPVRDRINQQAYRRYLQQNR